MCELLSVVDRFNAELNKVTSESRRAILRVTEMAYEMAPFSICIVKSICQFIHKQPADKKLIGVYILDAIIKGRHESVDEYRRLFDKELVNIMVDTFQKITTKSRLDFYNCRRTWKSRFSDVTLERLDNRINAIDPAWPVSPPKKGKVMPQSLVEEN